MMPFKGYFPWSVFMLCLLCFSGCVSTSPPVETSLNITSHPSDALCSIHQDKTENPGKQIVVFGTTPLKSVSAPGHAPPLWLRVEKRGYEPFIRQIMPEEQLTLDVTLKPVDSAKCRVNQQNPPGPVTQIAVLMPRVDYILRGTFSNETDTGISRIMGDTAVQSITQSTNADVQARLVTADTCDPDTIRSLWRDSRTTMAVVDPIRLDYFTCPATFETRSGRQSAVVFGQQQKADAMLIISGRIDRESVALKIHKTQLHILGTASSYTAGYNRAVSSGHSHFAYTVYTPKFSGMTDLQALLVDCRTGELLWLNKGSWNCIKPDNQEGITSVINDLLTGLPQKLKMEDTQ